MTLLLALAVGVLFGSGAYLLLKPDLLRVTVGVLLVANAANLALMSAGLSRGQPPVEPITPGEPVSDPLVQAMTVTALIISVATIALLLTIAYRVHRSHETVDLDELARREVEAEEELEREELQV